MNPDAIAFGVLIAQRVVRGLGLSYDEGRVVFAVLHRIMEHAEQKDSAMGVAELYGVWSREEIDRIAKEKMPPDWVPTL